MSKAIVMANRANNVPRAAEREPAPPILTGETVAVVHMRGVVELQRHGDVRLAEVMPVHTIRAGGQHHGVLVLRNNESRWDAGHMLTPGHEPVRTLTTSGHQSLVMANTENGIPRPADEQPTQTLRTEGGLAVVVPYQSEASIARDAPAATLTTRDRLALVIPYASGNGTIVADEQPASTLTQRDKLAVVWGDDDIDACRFRMFALHEIAGAMTLAHHVDGGAYVVTGNKRERMAQYGNAVTPPVMAVLVGRLLEVLQAETFTDLFCGAGGSSLGAALVGGQLRLGLNHWARAIETHATNFQDADHDCEDVSSLTTAQIRRYPDSDILMASPECTNHSLAKGARRRKPQAASLFDDGPGNSDEQDRSRATMWDVVRFAEQKILKGRPYKAIVVENVVDAFKWGANDDGGLFNAWLSAIRALGYDHEIVWLNSMFAHGPGPLVPQSRDRLYVVFWQRGVRAPNLRIEPPAWCPYCEKVVAGQQTWKRPGGRIWGRYGPQYFYSCPDCRGAVLPGAAPAASIIDDDLPAQIIGERARPLAPNTRERIRRGLERLSSEPFAIRLTHGGVPRPLTLPLVTLTQRHDPAVVFPVAGNTHERSPGNRARRAAERPLDTIHSTLDRAIVVPPMGNVDARPASTLPAPTQTTTTRAAVVTTEATR